MTNTQLRSNATVGECSGMRFAKVLTLLALTTVVGQAQAPVTAQKPLSIPPIEDRNLYAAFFNYHQGLITANQAAKTANPLLSAQLDQQMAAQLQISVSDLPTVIAATQQASKGYASIPAQRQRTTSLNWGNVKPPTPAQIEAQLNLVKFHYTMDAVLSLFKNLPPASWKTLHDYINGDFKKLPAAQILP